RGYSKVTRDITERKQTEDALAARTAQLEALNRELDAFSYSVSHDLRAPLRAIDGFSQALLDDCAEKLDDEGKAHLGRIRAAAQRMGQLIDDLLGLSRLSGSEPRRERVDLGSLAEKVAEELRAAQPERTVTFEIARGLVADADPHLVGIVLRNLLGNAWKFTSRRPDARIEVGSADLDGKPAFFVRDNGAGFDMAYANKLFGAFQRLHGQNEFAGNGIGLA